MRDRATDGYTNREKIQKDDVLSGMVTLAEGVPVATILVFFSQTSQWHTIQGAFRFGFHAIADRFWMKHDETALADELRLALADELHG